MSLISNDNRKRSIVIVETSHDLGLVVDELEGIKRELDLSKVKRVEVRVDEDTTRKEELYGMISWSRQMKISDQDFLKLVQYMLDNYGIDLSKKRTLIESRLSIPVKKMGFDSFSTFVDYAISDNSGKAVNLLTTKLTTNYTFFMREKEHFDFLKESVLPYLENKLEDKDIRIWSAGCSSGEEAYSIAMTIDEYFGAEKFFWDAKVLATDISSTMLSAAIKGVYDESRLEKMPEEWKRKYFKKLDEETYEIKENIKNEVIFRLFNLRMSSL